MKAWTQINTIISTSATETIYLWCTSCCLAYLLFIQLFVSYTAARHQEAMEVFDSVSVTFTYAFGQRQSKRHEISC